MSNVIKIPRLPLYKTTKNHFTRDLWVVRELDYKKEKSVYEKRKKTKSSPIPTLQYTFSGIWENSHLQVRSSSIRRSEGSRSLLHHSMRWYVWKDWLAGSKFRCTTSRGKKVFKEKKVYFQICFSLALGSYNRNSQISYYLPNNQNEIFFLFRKFPLHFSLL